MQVINFEMPRSAAGYVHRIGRTGRAYNTGTSISLVSLFVRITSTKPNVLENSILKVLKYVSVEIFSCGP